ncbi:MAG: LamG domain-containing protein, partial [Phycisphaerales bacterium]
SDNFDDVNDGAEAAFRSNQTDTFFIAGFPGFPFPEGLVPGATYYWRIDEVNDADPNSPWVGTVWSFSIPPKTAHDPSPADDAQFVATDVGLSWTEGFNAKLHTVYFGDDLDTVTNATGGAPQGTTTFAPGDLALETTYYWRVDEFDPPFTHTGDVWSFSTLPDIPITNPNLVGWWKFEAGDGDKVIDFSGHGNHGEIIDNVLWVPGQFNMALEFLGDNIGHVELPAGMVTTASGSILMWVNTDLTGNEGMFWYGTETDGDGFGGANEVHIHNQDAGTLGFAMEGPTDVRLDGPALAGAGWNHVAATWDETDGCRLYFNGAEVDFAAYTANMANLSTIRLGRPVATSNGNRYHDGLLDDVRLFDIAITADQVNEIMTKGEDPLKAANPNPRSGSTPGVDDVPPLTWSAGELASQHDVYFGTDRDAVESADASDTTGVYRGRQSATTFTPAEPLEWGTGPYFWRIDEINTDGTIQEGTVWSFTISDFTLVDGFETYTDNDAEGEAIWQTWLDGFGVATNGSQSGYTVPPYAEQTIVHSGGQSLPLQYNNTGGVMNSEVERKLDSPRDWTRNGVEELSIWFQGRPASVGSFTEGPVGTFTITATGADIWNQADEFHFAYRTLTGVGSIEAQVLSVEQTDNWAKAGVMIRETLDPGSKFAAVYMTPTNADGTATNGVRFQARTDTDASATSDTSVATSEQTALVAPQWVKIERDVAGNFRGYYSSNGTNWTPMSWNPQAISMEATVFIGLALTSHNNNAVTEAKFSNVRTTGTVSPTWTSQDIGIAANDAEPFYVAISNATGAPAVVAHPDASAANIETWTEWVIPLQTFADKGINLTDVDKVALGLGATGGAASGGRGIMFIDDIRLYRARPAGGQ